MSVVKASEASVFSQTLASAIELGLITPEQAEALCQQHSEEEVMLILEQIASDQVVSGQQCIGDHCTI